MQNDTNNAAIQMIPHPIRRAHRVWLHVLKVGAEKSPYNRCNRNVNRNSMRHISESSRFDSFDSFDLPCVRLFSDDNRKLPSRAPFSATEKYRCFVNRLLTYLRRKVIGKRLCTPKTKIELKQIVIRLTDAMLPLSHKPFKLKYNRLRPFDAIWVPFLWFG